MTEDAQLTSTVLLLLLAVWRRPFQNVQGMANEFYFDSLKLVGKDVVLERVHWRQHGELVLFLGCCPPGHHNVHCHWRDVFFGFCRAAKESIFRFHHTGVDAILLPSDSSTPNFASEIHQEDSEANMLFRWNVSWCFPVGHSGRCEAHVQQPRGEFVQSKIVQQIFGCVGKEHRSCSAVTSCVHCCRLAESSILWTSGLGL